VLQALVRATRVLVVLVVFVAVLLPVGSVTTGGPAPSAAMSRARPGPEDPRVGAVRALLSARAAALSRRDRAAWLATVDPAAPRFALEQARRFDALRDVPVTGWSYELDPSRTAAPSRAMDRRRGPGWWAPEVTVRYQLSGFDAGPSVEKQRLTFVPRGARWFVAADDDFGPPGYELWDGGRVVAVRGRSSLVLAHPDAPVSLRRITAAADAAVPRVTSVWGPGWSQRVVVLVPSTEAELRRLVGSGDASHIAALTTAEVSRGHVVGDRIVVNPANFARLGALGRRVVLTHEVTHVATRRATGPATPSWVVEGFADYVGYLGTAVPPRVAAAELRADVRRRRVPARLPSDAQFDTGNAELAQVYEQAWLAVTLLARRRGAAAVVRFYRALGSGRGPDAALRQEFGMDLPGFTAAWRQSLLGLR
jgi:hypothetical protein